MTIIDQDANPERESLIGQTSGSSKRPLQPSRMRARGQAELLLMAPRRRRIYRFTSRVCFSRHQAPPRLPWSGVRGLWSVLVPCLSPLASRLSPLTSRLSPRASCLLPTLRRYCLSRDSRAISRQLLSLSSPSTPTFPSCSLFPL